MKTEKKISLKYQGYVPHLESFKKKNKEATLLMKKIFSKMAI